MFQGSSPLKWYGKTTKSSFDPVLHVHFWNWLTLQNMCSIHFCFLTQAISTNLYSLQVNNRQLNNLLAIDTLRICFLASDCKKGVKEKKVYDLFLMLSSD